jgi:MFS family permease
LVAAWLARRIGLVNTMVFTHIPSSLLLVTVAFAPSFGVAAVLFLLREGLVEMDVPTRQSYVMAVVPPEDRTVASGVTHIVRTAGWAVAPSIAGVFMQRLSLLAPLIVGASLKIAYDVLLYAVFRSVKPPEERAEAPAAPTSRGEPTKYPDVAVISRVRAQPLGRRSRIRRVRRWATHRAGGRPTTSPPRSASPAHRQAGGVFGVYLHLSGLSHHYERRGA